MVRGLVLSQLLFLCYNAFGLVVNKSSNFPKRPILPVSQGSVPSVVAVASLVAHRHLLSTCSVCFVPAAQPHQPTSLRDLRDNFLSTSYVTAAKGRHIYAGKVGLTDLCFTLLHLVLAITVMTTLLQGKTAIITGAVTGIGRAIAIEYLKHGANVAVNYFPDDKSTAQFQELQKEAGQSAPLVGHAGDITKPETGQELVRKTVEKWGRLDIFVSNAGVCQFADFLT